jgi:zinc protease
MCQRLLSITLGIYLLVGGGFAYAAVTKDYTLDNGLKLVVREDHRAPVAVLQVWYKVGGSYEILGKTGLSHLLEHLMFQGTKTHAAGEFSRLIAERGGNENAATSADYTFYYEELAVQDLPLALALEADRMQNLQLTPEIFAKELQVVKEERRLRVDDVPQALTYERFQAMAFMASPYHNPTVGWMQDLDQLQVTDVKRWYQKWYNPGRAILVVVGDVNADQIYQLVQQHFGSIPAAPPLKLTQQLELPNPGERAITLHLPAELPWLALGYNVPSVVTQQQQQAWEPYALMVLAAILDGDDSARLPTELMRGTQIATNVSVTYDLYSRMNKLFVLMGTPSRGHTIKQLEQGFNHELGWLQKELVPADELQRVKTQLLAQTTYAKDSLAYQAQELGALEAVGLSWQLADSYNDNITAVTPAQIRAVALKYFVPERLTIARLYPMQKPLIKQG